MERRYHAFRRQVLLARQAYIGKQVPEQLADRLLAAARELVILTGRITPVMLRKENRQALMERLEEPDLTEPAQLLAQAHLLEGEVPWLKGAEEQARWQAQAYQLLWRLDCILIELAGSFRGNGASGRYFHAVNNSARAANLC